jgi:hypothetical protein
VPTMELSVLVLTLVTAAVGGWSIYWARSETQCWRGRGGRFLFVLNLLALGGTGLVAASTRAQGLAPLGLVAGLLIVGMTWEGPPSTARRRSPLGQQIPPDGQMS